MADDAELPLPAEPVALKRKTRALLERSRRRGSAWWPKASGSCGRWKVWRPELAARGMRRGKLKANQNELRLWVMSKRASVAPALTGGGGETMVTEEQTAWSVGLTRAGIAPDADAPSLRAKIEGLGDRFVVDGG